VIFTLAEAHADFPYVTSDPRLAIFAAKDGGIDLRLARAPGRTSRTSSSRAPSSPRTAIPIITGRMRPGSIRSNCR
jgi:hypothetical protein